MDKVYRRTQILELVGAGSIATQAELSAKLGRRGIHVTQATLSRDIEELGLVKTREGYRLPGAAAASEPPQPPLDVVLKEFVREVRLAANLVVIRTHPGNAQTVAYTLDASPWPEVVGTVAGDDTIFLATAGPRDAAHVRKKIMTQLGAGTRDQGEV
ncbi:MAG: arginine repressor [Terriglobia bacterium]